MLLQRNRPNWTNCGRLSSHVRRIEWYQRQRGDDVYVGYSFMEKPFMRFFFAARDKNLLKQSITMMNKIGDNRSPWLRPLVALNFPLGFPFIIIEKLVVDVHPLIHRLHVNPKPLIFIQRHDDEQYQSYSLLSPINSSSYFPFCLV